MQRMTHVETISSAVEMASARWERVKHQSPAQMALDASQMPTVTKPFAVPNTIRKDTTIAGLSARQHASINVGSTLSCFLTVFSRHVCTKLRTAGQVCYPREDNCTVHHKCP